MPLFAWLKYKTDHPAAFRREVAAYRKRDRANPPAEGMTLFVGSSLMEMWTTLESDMTPLSVLNRAISGSKIVQWPHYVDELVLPHRPSAVVLFAGSNDTHGEKCKPPERILGAFCEFESKIHAAMPETKVWYLSILPSPCKERWDNWDRIQAANRLIWEHAETKETLGFIDATEAFLENGKPIPEFFQPDMVHLNDKGYERWAGVVRGYLV